MLTICTLVTPNVILGASHLSAANTEYPGSVHLAVIIIGLEWLPLRLLRLAAAELDFSLKVLSAVNAARWLL
jgi:hypothetical protein